MTARHQRLFIAAAVLLAMAVLVQGAPARALETIATRAILMDMSTGAILLEKDADTPAPPASMSKLMTLHMVFERLREGSLSLDGTFVVSENAWRKGGAKSGSSTMFLNPGKRVTVEDLVRGIAVQSGNDACIVVAEGLSGSESAFADSMTRRGRELGLRSSTFLNATGWPDPGHEMSMRDLALLARLTIEEFPEYYHYYSEKTFTYNGIKQGNRNPLLYRDTGADGLKTGHTKASGYGLVASAKRNDRRLILVANGMPSIKARSRESARVLEWGFREFGNYTLFKAGDTVSEAEVWLGVEDTVPLVIQAELTVTLPRRARADMKVSVVYEGPAPSPIAAGDPIATLVVKAPDVPPVEVPLVAGADVDQLGLFGRLVSALKAVIWGFAS